MLRFGIRRTGLTAALLIGTLVATPAIAQTPSQISDRGTASAPAVRSANPTTVTTTLPPVEPIDAGRSLLISDSAWLSFKLYGTIDSVQGFEHSFALASCRRRVATSCENFDGFVPITMLDELDNHPEGYSTLIVATGYNDSDFNFPAEVEATVDLARSHGYRHIVWVTLRSNVSYESPDDAGFAEVFERSNATLQAIVDAGTYPEITIADWATYARDQPSWFAADGIHLRRLGSFAAGDYLSRKIAFLEQRGCPQPSEAGVEPLDPCPDPDVTGPVIDLASLYPVTQSSPEQNFQLSWEGSSSWPDPPWWELPPEL